MRFQSNYEKGLARVSKSAQTAISELYELEQAVKASARKAAGLDENLPESQAQEIRNALRSMSPADREKVVQNAVASNDNATIRAITQSPASFLYGDLKTPVNALVEVLLETASPGFKERLDEINSATDFVGASVKSFSEATGKLRDFLAEDEGAQQLAASKTAEAILSQ